MGRRPGGRTHGPMAGMQICKGPGPGPLATGQIGPVGRAWASVRADRRAGAAGA